jgi:hypothetical protein
VNNEWAGDWKEAVEAQFEVLCRHLAGNSQERLIVSSSSEESLVVSGSSEESFKCPVVQRRVS